MDYYYEDIYSSKNVFMRYYYKSKNNDEASRIFKQQYPINGISKIIGVRENKGNTNENRGPKGKSTKKQTKGL